MICPRCGNTQWEFVESIGTMRCTACGFRLFQDGVGRPRRPKPSGQRKSDRPSPHPTGDRRPPVHIDLPFGLDLERIEADSERDAIRMRSRCTDAMYALARGDRKGAKKALLSALEISENYADAWLFLAGLADSAEEQREYLEHVLACDPGNPLATKALLELDGLPGDEPPPGEAVEPGQVAGKLLICPNCGGRLEYDEREREVTCYHCGYLILDADELARHARQSTLVEGLLRRKSRAISWDIGEKWLRCAGCGAITTLTRRMLTATCRFCDSRHVILESPGYRFEQPDLIVPFSLDEDDAKAALERKLRSGIRAITRFFADPIANVELQGAYLPFWAFDAEMEVIWHHPDEFEAQRRTVLLGDVLYFAASSPPREFVERLETFDLTQGVDYDPRLLVEYPAELYDVDAMRASIEVRSKLTGIAIDRTEIDFMAGGVSWDYDNIKAVTGFMTYRLVLLPVWVGRMVEVDGDTRRVLVNGQTGEVVLGKLRKR